MSEDFDNFKCLVRKVLSVPKEEIERIKEQEKLDKKSKPKKQPNKIKP